MMRVVDHVALSVHDLDRERAFYLQVFDMREEGSGQFGEGRIRMVLLRSPDGMGIELVAAAGSRPRPVRDLADAAGVRGYAHVGIAVDDLEESLRQVVDAGGRVVSEPAPASLRPTMRFAVVADPDGNLIELVQP
jgi:catechol 2,3-dioxygenase-like lactoylglutathione lyase family enzyme